MEQIVSIYFYLLYRPESRSLRYIPQDPYISKKKRPSKKTKPRSPCTSFEKQPAEILYLRPEAGPVQKMQRVAAGVNADECKRGQTGQGGGD